MNADLPKHFLCRKSSGYPSRRLRQRGYLLFEIIIALGVFAMVVLAMAQSMQSTMASLSMGQMDAYVREELASRIALTRLEKINPGVTHDGPDSRGVIYTRETDALDLITAQGIALTDLYIVRWTATWMGPRDEMSKTYQIYLHVPKE